MAKPDLITQAQLAARLATAGLSAAEASLLPALAASASAAVRAHCGRDFSLLDYDELHQVAAPARSVILRQYPIASVSRVATGATAALSVWNDRADTFRASVTLSGQANDAETVLTPTGLVLARHVAGVASSIEIDFGDGPPEIWSVAQLVAAIDAAGSAAGWHAEAVSGFEGAGVLDFRPIQGAIPAGRGMRAQLSVHAEDLDFVADEALGVLYLGRSSGASGFASTESARWGPSWDGAFDDAAPFGGSLGLRVVYSAGYATTPADVVQAVAETVKGAIERVRTDGALRSESDGVYSYQTRDLAEIVTLSGPVRSALAPYVAHRA